MNQLKKMFSSTRLIATIVMIFSLIMTLVAAFVVSMHYKMLRKNKA